MSISGIVLGKPTPFHGSRSAPEGEKCARGSGLILIDEGHSKAGASPEMSKIPNPVRLLFEYRFKGGAS